MRTPFFLLVSFFIIVFAIHGHCQEAKVTPAVAEEQPSDDDGFVVGADLVSRYVWRGMDLGNSPAIQPTLGFSWKGLKIGAWGSYALASHSERINDTTTADAGHYSEIDLYLSYTYKWVTLQFYDYFTVNGFSPNQGNIYYNYKNGQTGHTFEGSLTFEGPEKFPMSFTVSTLFYGADKNKDSAGVYGKGTGNNYSTYLELGYKFNITKYNVDLKPFIGGIPFGSSWYGPYAGITNIGLSARKELPITCKYSLPLQAALITNPQAQSIFLVFTVSL